MNAAMFNALELGEEIIKAVKIRVESIDATRRADLLITGLAGSDKKVRRKDVCEGRKMIREMH
jgi:hypothetical protein